MRTACLPPLILKSQTLRTVTMLYLVADCKDACKTLSLLKIPSRSLLPGPSPLPTNEPVYIQGNKEAVLKHKAAQLFQEFPQAGEMCVLTCWALTDWETRLCLLSGAEKDLPQASHYDVIFWHFKIFKCVSWKSLCLLLV